MCLLRKEACYFRLSPADKDGSIRSILYANWRQSVARPGDIEVIDSLDINTLWRDLANLCGFTDHRWANYLGLRSKAIDIEQRIAEEYFSTKQMNLFREECVVCGVEGLSLHPTPYTLHTEHGEVIRRLRSVIVSAMQGNTLNIQSLRDIVDFMRKHDAQFPEFRHSATYKLFEPPIFENKKKACGYFF